MSARLHLQLRSSVKKSCKLSGGVALPLKSKVTYPALAVSRPRVVFPPGRSLLLTPRCLAPPHQTALSPIHLIALQSILQTCRAVQMCWLPQPLSLRQRNKFSPPQLFYTWTSDWDFDSCFSNHKGEAKKADRVKLRRNVSPRRYFDRMRIPTQVGH